MWILLAILSALSLGGYDIFKKLSLRDNNVPGVLFLNTLFCSLLMLPVLIPTLSHGQIGPDGTATGNLHILLKSAIVLSSWILGYFSIKHLPLTIAGPINAARPVIVLVGALLIFGERLNALQWGGVTLGFFSLFFISRIGVSEGFSFRHSIWLWMAIGATTMGAVSALYDKYLMTLYQPLQVQAWYSLYQCFIMGVVMLIINSLTLPANRTPLKWRWSILCISVFLTVADVAYFYALSLPGSMIAIVSMLRRGAVIVSFIYGALALREQHIRMKLIDLCVLLVGLTLLVIGSK
ncbi:MAG: DMT family transporter [Muribaculum sp.]|nr:DMT family transporter [Muribaculaceae bacterium]MCM1080159.1 DMT family transporter [Muribaculum sp.]